jgi:RNA-directed DNA polymerase
VQAAVKIVLEPIFEADFLPCSFGFRPKRSAHDALHVLVDESWQGARWVVETDIANCFTVIPHEKLMQAVEERISDQGILKLLRAMLRAGVMQDGRCVERRPELRRVVRHRRCCATCTCTGWTGRGIRASTACWCAIAMTWW